MTGSSRTSRAVFLSAVAVVVVACSENPLSPKHAAETRVAPVLALTQSVKVTNNGNSGPGSFRDAIEAANSSESVTAIKFDKDLGTIILSATVTYTGSQNLEINGSGNEISGSAIPATGAALASTGGSDLVVRRLAITNAPGEGLRVLVPSTATGTVGLTLDQVIVTDNGMHGVLFNDQTGYLADPLSLDSAGSDASLRFSVNGSRFEDNGFALIDQDGIRVNEGGIGGIEAVVRHSSVIGNGGDGIEFDERRIGDAVFTVEHSMLNENGAFTSSDYDDGIDVDEAGAGNINARFNHVVVNDNFEQGVDLNENHEGDLRVVMNVVEASGNDQEGVEFEEDDDFAGGGDIIAELHRVTTLDNGRSGGADAGLKIREKGTGNVSALIVNAVSSDNQGVDGDELMGLLIREDAAGNLEATIENAITLGNSGNGIGFDENSSGNLVARVLTATSSNNDGAGVAADQAATGSGSLDISSLTAVSNADGAVTSNGVTVQYLD